MNYRGAKQYILKRLRSELSEQLYYHSLAHTLDVLRVADELCGLEGVRGVSRRMVKTAALFHDAGFVFGKHEGHELASCDIAKETLPLFGYDDEQIQVICSMIMATKIPQSPASLLEQILCDADLDYLGRPDFYKIGAYLYKELEAFQLMSDAKLWDAIQIKFLQNHHYFTVTNAHRREPIKIAYIKKLQEGQ